MSVESLFDIEPQTCLVSELRAGSVLHSGHVVESVATGGRRYGNSVQVTFTNGNASSVGASVRVLVRTI